LVYFVVGWALNTTIEAIPAGLPAATTIAVASIWVAIRDWPRRAHYLFAAAVVAVGFIASAPVTGVLGRAWAVHGADAMPPPIAESVPRSRSGEARTHQPVARFREIDDGHPGHPAPRGQILHAGFVVSTSYGYVVEHTGCVLRCAVGSDST
jgi:hypothetical protein